MWVYVPLEGPRSPQEGPRRVSGAPQTPNPGLPRPHIGPLRTCSAHGPAGGHPYNPSYEELVPCAPSASLRRVVCTCTHYRGLGPHMGSHEGPLEEGLGPRGSTGPESQGPRGHSVH